VPPVGANVAVTLRRPSRVRIAWIDSLGRQRTVSLVADPDPRKQPDMTLACGARPRKQLGRRLASAVRHVGRPFSRLVVIPPATEEGRVKIEDHALIGDLRTSALVGRNGSIDWLCLPRVDSAARFAALLAEENGRWLLCPSARARRVARRYREGTPILETDFETDTGAARVIDFMPLRNGGAPQLVRTESPAVEEPSPEQDPYWRDWSSWCAYGGEWREVVLRSLIALKALSVKDVHPVLRISGAGTPPS
jgi:Domain of unknown function (DUF5911)